MTPTRSPQSLRARHAFFLQEGGAALAFALVFTVQAVYFVRVLHLSPLQLVLVGTVLELACFLLEIPTGVIADTSSRRLSVVLGFAGLGLGFALLVLVPSFAGVLAAQVVAALGYTCLSGAQTAWLTDEVGEDRVGEVLVRGSQVGTVGGLIGILLSGGLGSVSLLLPVALGAGLMLLLAAALAVWMPEQGFSRPSVDTRPSWADASSTFREGVRTVRGRPVLMALLGVALLYGASTEAQDRLWQFHLLQTFTLPRWGGLTTAAWFSLISLAGLALGLVVTEGVRRRLVLERAAQVAPWLAGLTAVSVLAGLSFALAGSLVAALVAFLVGGVARGLYGPLYQTWLNQGLDPRVRATVLSVAAQADALGQVAGGPAVGALGTASGVRPALAVSALLQLPVLWLCARLHRGPAGRAVIDAP